MRCTPAQVKLRLRKCERCKGVETLRSAAACELVAAGPGLLTSVRIAAKGHSDTGDYSAKKKFGAMRPSRRTKLLYVN